MSKRLQVVFEEEELRELQEAAREEGVTLSAWVRRTLRVARAGKPSGSIETQLGAVRAAAQHRHPTADIDQMLAEVERGYAAPAKE